MKFNYLLVPASALALAACGSEPEGPRTAEEIAEAVDSMVRPTPGLYRSTASITEFEIPGMPPEQAAQMKEMMGSAGSQSSEFCMTKEQAEEGFKSVARELGEGQQGVKCEFSKFEASGSNLESSLACTGPGGVNVNMDMDGTIEPTKSNITMRMNQKSPQIPGGEVRMAMEVKSERIGDCP